MLPMFLNKSYARKEINPTHGFLINLATKLDAK
jgi:hypothetical protein